MRREELLGAKLLSLYTAYKKRQAAGIIQFYSDRLIGLEDSLLQTRHQLLAMAVLLHQACITSMHHVPISFRLLCPRNPAPAACSSNGAHCTSWHTAAAHAGRPRSTESRERRAG